MAPIRYQAEGAHHVGGGASGTLPQQGQILQQQYYPVVQQAVPMPTPLHQTYAHAPIHNYCDNVTDWFAGMSLNPAAAQYYAPQTQSCG